MLCLFYWQEAAEQDNIGKMIMSFVVNRLLFLGVIYLLTEINLLSLAWIFLLLKIMY